MTARVQGSESAPGTLAPPPGESADQGPDDWQTVRQRIAESARRAFDHETAYRAELERRNDLCVHAFDHNLAPVRDIAEAAGISAPNLYRIVGRDG